MNSQVVLDWPAHFISQMIAQCQLWFLLGCLAILVALLIGAGVAMLQIMETLDGNSTGSSIPH